MDRCGSLWNVLGSLWIVVDRCGSFWVVPRFSNYPLELSVRELFKPLELLVSVRNSHPLVNVFPYEVFGFTQPDKSSSHMQPKTAYLSSWT